MKILFSAVLSLGVLNAVAADPQIFVVSDEVFVRWRTVEPTERSRIYADIGAQAVWESNLVSGLELVRLNGSVDLHTAWEDLRRHGQVIYAEPNFVQRREEIPAPSMNNLEPSWLGSFFSNDPRLREQWALLGEFGMKVQEAWEKIDGQIESVTVGIIDTGIDADHPEFAGRIGPGYDFIDESERVVDVGGHGTHVAGIVGAIANNGIGVAGIAQNVKFLPIRAVPNRGDETDLHIIRSLEFAVEHGARIVNCSFGKDASSQAVAEAFLAAGERGVLAVVAAGNSSANLDNQPMYPASFHTPNMLVVGALNRDGNRAFFSNVSKTGVDLFAPGARILSTIPSNSYATYDGTSMASPAAAGAAALVMGLRPELSPGEIRDLLKGSVRPIESLKTLSDSGGTVDASAAVSAALGF